MSVKLIAENILESGDFLSATEQEGEHPAQPVPNSANTGDFRLLTGGDIADFTFSGTTEAGTNATTIIDLTLNAFGDDYFIGGTVTMTSGAQSGNSRTVTDFVQASGTLTVAAFAGAPGVGQTFTLTVAFSTREFCIELIASGDAGDATFKWSHDGGTTYFGRDDPDQADWLGEQTVHGTHQPNMGKMAQTSDDRWIVVYEDSGDNKIYSKRSSDQGLTWDTPVEVRATGEPRALIRLKSGRLLYYDTTTLNYSDDDGDTWSSTITPGISGTVYDAAELPNGNVIVVITLTAAIYAYLSNDGGMTFGSLITVAADANGQSYPSVVVAENGDIVCAYQTDEDVVNDYEIKCKISTDSGATWGSAIDVIDFVTVDFLYPTLERDIGGRLFCAAREITANEKIVYSVSSDNGATWGAKADLISLAADLRCPNLALLDGHVMTCLYHHVGDGDLDMVRRGIWETYSANACPCAVEATPQHLICDAGIIWHGGAGDTGDSWTFEAEYDYAATNLIEDSPSHPWRSEQDNMVATVVLDMGANERFLADGVAFFGCNLRTFDFEMDRASTFNSGAGASPDVDATMDFTLTTAGIVDSVTGNAVADAALMANYKDHELAGRYYLRMISGTDNGKTWKIKDNAGNYIFLDTTAATNIAAPDAFVIFQRSVAEEFTNATAYRYMRSNIAAQHTAEDYYQIGTMVAGKVITLTRAWTVGYGRSHHYDVEMLRTAHGGMVPSVGADRKRVFTLSWPAAETTVDEVLALLDYIEGRNIVLIPDSTVVNSEGCYMECYLTKLVGDVDLRNRIKAKFDMSFTLEEVL